MDRLRNIYKQTSQEIASFIDVVNAVDKRKELLANSKSRKSPVNTLFALSERCLTVATNKDIPDSIIANALYASFVGSQYTHNFSFGHNAFTGQNIIAI